MLLAGHSPEMSEGGQTTRRSWWRTPLLHRVAKLQQREDQVFLVLALVIGALTGLAVVAFILLTERMGMRLYPAGGAPWRRLLFPVVGSLRIGYLLFRYFPYARGSGVPQTKAALYAREGRILLRTVLGKFFCTSATLASGIPLGREGPSVQVGAGIASVLGRLLGLRDEKVKSLLPAGGLVSVVFTKLLLGMRERFLRLPQKTLWFQPLAGGLLVGLVGWFVPQVMGVGYEYVGYALNGNMALKLMALLVVLKLITVTTSYASGNAGGIFGPALFIGAMLGGSLGTLAHRLFPAYTATPGAYALVGM